MSDVSGGGCVKRLAAGQNEATPSTVFLNRRRQGEFRRQVGSAPSLARMWLDTEEEPSSAEARKRLS